MRWPVQEPARRLATIEAAGRAAVPFTSGLLVGIGESRRQRLADLRLLLRAHRAHGHLQVSCLAIEACLWHHLHFSEPLCHDVLLVAYTCTPRLPGWPH